MSTTSPPGSWYCGLWSYCSFLRELVDLALRIAQLGQEIVRVGAERGRRRGRRRIATCQAKARTHDADGTIDVGHGRERLEQPALGDLRMLEHGRHVENLAGGNAILVEERRPIMRRFRRQRRLDLGIELQAVTFAILTAGKARIGHEVRAADQARER